MEMKEFTNREAVIIGLKSGLILIALIILLLLPVLGLFGLLGSIAVGLPGIISGITGALIFKRFAKSIRAIWAGAVFGAILGVCAFVFSGAAYNLCPILGGC